MKQNLTHIAIVVDDYDKAIQFYTQKLNFTLLEDTILSDTKRWVLVRPKGANECSLLLISLFFSFWYLFESCFWFMIIILFYKSNSAEFCIL